MTEVKVNVSKKYSVFIGEGLLKEAGCKIYSACGGEKALIVTDDITDKLYSQTAARSLQAQGYEVSKFVFPNGENSKNTDTYISLLCVLEEAKLTRSDVLVALGGGVTGDLTGFAAATYLRGIAFAQIPTTLLAMVDSSVGGKTAVNLKTGKNLAGVFYQPCIVLCDLDTLKTLKEETFNDGCAEMIKHGFILSKELFELLKSPLLTQMEDIIARNVVIKRDIVAMDERDNGIRQILNFGHTAGHGIEKHSGYSVTHGKAVAIGMAIAARGASRTGLCDDDCYAQLIETLKIRNLPFETDIPAEKIIEASLSDKKRRNRNITLIVPEKIGKCVLKTFSLDEAADFLRLGMKT